jgi:hypothetical protein
MRFSGVAWCWSGQPADISIITQWPSPLGGNADRAKVPTEICYFNNKTPRAWGYDVPLDVRPIRWFKLLIVEESLLGPDLQFADELVKARTTVRELGLDPVKVVADYLRFLWLHALQQLIRQRGESAIDGCPFKVWITVPAIWDHKARDKMMLAAEMAGILEERFAGATEVELVAEPEAAALAALKDIQSTPGVKVSNL